MFMEQAHLRTDANLVEAAQLLSLCPTSAVRIIVDIANSHNRVTLLLLIVRRY